MDDIVDVEIVDSDKALALKTVGWVSYVLSAPLFLLLYLPGAIAWFMISIWFLYRIVRGMVAMNASRPVGQ